MTPEDHARRLAEIRNRWAGCAEIGPPKLVKEDLGSDKGYYECPLCGEGGVPADTVADWKYTGACCGMQVYGIGDEHVALEKATPHAAADVALLIAELDRVTAERDEAREVRAVAVVERDHDRFHAQYLLADRDRLAATVARVEPLLRDIAAHRQTLHACNPELWHRIQIALADPQPEKDPTNAPA